jgi:uncharacterized protein YkwD
MSFSIRYIHVFLVALFFCFSFAGMGGTDGPPPTQPVIGNNFSKSKTAAAIAATTASTPALFSIGEPTDDEQLYLELINRSRANPQAEVNRLISLDDPYIKVAMEFVDTNLLVSQFSTIPPAAPLSFNAILLTAARNHTQYQFDNGIQTHIGPGTNTLRERLDIANYIFNWAAENVYTYAQSVQHGHAGFEVDWSGDTANGGMQTPPGHRNNMHDKRFVEIGIGVLNGTNQVGTNIAVGPQLVTQDFGTPYPAMTYITGVAYYDLNGNNFYDLGEGLGGVNVVVDGVASYAVTAGSGGYSVPVPPGGNYTVRFQATGAPDFVTSVSVPNTNNVKLDFKPSFAFSSVTSAPSTVYAGVSNLVHFSSLAGATGYRSRVFDLQPAPFEGAEGPLTNVTLTTFGNYPATSTTVKASGTSSFHLRHVSDTISNTTTAYPQYIQFVNPFYVEAGARIDFKSRLGIAFAGTGTSGPGEVARLEISLDEGQTWSSIWSQPGITLDHGPDNSEKTFNARSVSLINYLGKLVLLRFNFDVDPAIGWFDQAADKYGWYLDDISVTGAEQGINPTITALDASATFQFVPADPGNYIMQFGAVAGTRNFPMGPWYPVTAQPTPPLISFDGQVSIARGSISMAARRVSGTITNIIVESASNPAGPWAVENGASFTGPVNDEYTLFVPMNGGIRFYRATAN